MKEKKVGVKLFLLLLCENFLLVLESTAMWVGTQAHLDLSNMAATALGCTICEGCFHSTATSLFLAGSLPHYSCTETGLSTKTIFPSALLFARQVSLKTQAAKHWLCADCQGKTLPIVTLSAENAALQFCSVLCSVSPNETEGWFRRLHWHEL